MITENKSERAELMGSFANPTNTAFSKCFNSEIYVDKSELITFTNKKINSLQQYIVK